MNMTRTACWDENARPTADLLVLGLGNTLLSDEGVGVHVINALSEANPPNMTCLDGGTLSFTLADAIASHPNLIVVDASQLDANPGTMRWFHGQAMDDLLTRSKRRSVHEVGLCDLLAIATLTDNLPQQRALLAIQPEEIDWGPNCSRSLQTVIPTACEQIRRVAATWRQQGAHHG